MAGLMRAITAAELEIEGELTEPRHQALLSQLGDHHLDARELALFPDYLVCINERDLQGLEDDELMEMLSHGMPVKCWCGLMTCCPSGLAVPATWRSAPAAGRSQIWRSALTTSSSCSRQARILCVAALVLSKQ